MRECAKTAACAFDAFDAQVPRNVVVASDSTDALRYRVVTGGNTGTIEFYRRMAAEEAAAPPAIGFSFGPKPIGNGLVAMIAPPGTSTTYGISGRPNAVAADGSAAVHPDDVGPLRAAGVV